MTKKIQTTPLLNNSTDTITIAQPSMVIETITNSAASFTVYLNSCITTQFNPGDSCTIPVQFNNSVQSGISNSKHFLPTDPSANLLHGIKLQLKTYDQTYGSQESLVYYSPTVNGKDTMWQCPSVSELPNSSDATKFSTALRVHWSLQSSYRQYPGDDLTSFPIDSNHPVGNFWLWQVYVNDTDQGNGGRVECNYADGNTDFLLVSRNNTFNRDGDSRWWGDNHCGKIGSGEPFTTCIFGTINDYLTLSQSN